jgi:hypothetical protein
MDWTIRERGKKFNAPAFAKASAVVETMADKKTQRRKVEPLRSISTHPPPLKLRRTKRREVAKTQRGKPQPKR